MFYVSRESHIRNVVAPSVLLSVVIVTISLHRKLRAAKSMSTAIKPFPSRGWRRMITAVSGSSILVLIFAPSKLAVLDDEEKNAGKQKSTESSEQKRKQKSERDNWLHTVRTSVPCWNARCHKTLVQCSKQ